MLGRRHHLVIDCPDPAELARFYSALLDQPIPYAEHGRGRRRGDSPRAALGATKLAGDGVFADPVGHPFCLISRPAWAEPLRD